jgi:hypothetical protein
LGARLASELRHAWQSFWGPLRLCLLLGLGVGLVVGVSAAVQGEHDVPGPVMVVLFMGYGLWGGLHLGVGLGVGRLCWRLVGAWALLPFVLVPGCLALATWAASPAFGWLARGCVDALLAGAADHQALVLPPLQERGLEPGQIHGPGWELGLSLLLGVLSLELVWLFLSTPSAWLWLLGLVGLASVVVLVGTLPPSLVSVVLVVRGVVVRYRRRQRPSVGGGGRAPRG